MKRLNEWRPRVRRVSLTSGGIRFKAYLERGWEKKFCPHLHKMEWNAMECALVEAARRNALPLAIR